MSGPADINGRWEKGLAAYAGLFEIETSEVLPELTRRVGSRMATETILAAGGDAWVEDALSLRDRSLIVITALATLGVTERLRGHVRRAIQNGATPEEIEAALCLLALYAGYAHVSVAMEAAREELTAIDAERG